MKIKYNLRQPSLLFSGMYYAGSNHEKIFVI